MTEYTPVEACILERLADGMPHTAKELHGCLCDDLGDLSNVRAHLSRLRKKLRPRGEDIVCIVGNHANAYRHVRLLASATDGRR